MTTTTDPAAILRLFRVPDPNVGTTIEFLLTLPELAGVLDELRNSSDGELEVAVPAPRPSPGTQSFMCSTGVTASSCFRPAKRPSMTSSPNGWPTIASSPRSPARGTHSGPPHQPPRLFGLRRRGCGGVLGRRNANASSGCPRACSPSEASVPRTRRAHGQRSAGAVGVLEARRRHRDRGHRGRPGLAVAATKSRSAPSASAR